MGRLVQAAEAVDDPNLDQEVLKASTLSHLVNLGSEYAQSSPTYKTVLIGNEQPFLERLWENSTNSVLLASNDLESILTGVPSASSAIIFGRTILQRIQLQNTGELANSTYLALAANRGRYYTEYPNMILLSSGVFGASPRLGSRCFEWFDHLEEFLTDLTFRRIAVNGENLNNICMDLFSTLMDCLADLNLRYEEMLNDLRTGQSLWTQPGKVGWFNHQKRYNNVRAMMKQMVEYWNDYCDDHGSGLMTMPQLYDLQTAVDALDRPPPDEPLPQSGFKLPDWAAAAGVTIVGGAIVIGIGVTLPAWGLGALTIMGAAAGLSIVRQ
jgi:hypothetical protein